MDTQRRSINAISNNTKQADRRLIFISRLVLALTVFLVVATLTIMVSIISTTEQTFDLEDTTSVILAISLILSSSVVGTLIIARHPRHGIGWILLVTGISWSIMGLSDGFRYISYYSIMSPTHPIVEFFVWISFWIVAFAPGMPIIFLPLYFPTGQLPSRRWRWVAVAGAIGLFLITLSSALDAGPMDGIDIEIYNPYGLNDGESFRELLNNIGAALASFAVTGGVISLILRFRQADDEDRTQMKWVLYTIITGITVMLLIDNLARLLPDPVAAEASKLSLWSIWLVLNAIPLSIGIAILKHHLFDIDIIIRKTLIYGALTAMTVVVYIVVVGATTGALQTQNNVLLSLLALAVAGAAFIPARQRLSALADRYLPYSPPPTEKPEREAVSTSQRTSQHGTKSTHKHLVLLSQIMFAFSISITAIAVGIVIYGRVSGAVDVQIAFIEMVRASAIITYGLVAILVIARYPRHMVGWLLCLISFFLSLSALAVTVNGLEQEVSGDLGFIGDVAEWVGLWIWMPSSLLVFVGVPHIFPNGRLLSRRWRPAAIAFAVGFAINTLVLAFHPGPFQDNPANNPFGIQGAQTLLETLNTIAGPLTTIGILAGFASFLLRFRRSRGIERTQMKWFVYPVVLGVVTLSTLAILREFVPEDTGDVLYEISIVFNIVLNSVVPIAIGIAILRHQLFDIDIIIRKSLIYGTLIGGLGVLYVIAVTGLQLMSRIFTGPQSDIMLVLTTLAISALFNPVRRRIQAFIDRQFYRAKVDFKVAFTNFAREVRSLINLDELLQVLVSRTSELLHIAHGAVFLQDEDKFVLTEAQNLPDESLSLPLDDQTLSRLESGMPVSQPEHRVFPLLVPLIAPQPASDQEQNEQLIGVLALGPRLSDQQYSREDQVLLGGLADQAGTAIYVAQLIAQQQEEAARREAYLNSPSGRAEILANELVQSADNALIDLYQLVQTADSDPETASMLNHLPRALASLDRHDMAALSESYHYILASQHTPELLAVGLRQLTATLGATDFRELPGSDDARRLYAICQKALDVDTIMEITALLPELRTESSPTKGVFEKLAMGLEGLLPVTEALYAYERVESTQDQLSYLAGAVERLNQGDRMVRAELRAADRPIIHQVVETWLAVVTGSMSDLQARAKIALQLLTKHTWEHDNISLVLNLRNDGRGAALNVRVTLAPAEEYTLLDETAHLEHLGVNEEGQLTLRVRPRLSNGVSQFRARFVVMYDDPRGSDYVEHYADVVVLIPQDGEFQFIRNPYVVGTPLNAGSPLFFGRDDLFTFIADNLAAAHRNNLVLIGQRRTGKSSLLKQLPLRLGDEIVPVYLDGQSIALDTGLTNFFYGLATEICFALEDRGLAIDLPHIDDFAASPATSFEHNFLVSIRERIGNRHLLLMLDEFEELEAAVQRGNLDASIFGFLRHLIQHGQGLSTIFCGTHRMEELAADYWSVLFNISLYRHVGFLDHSEAMHLIREPVEDHGMLYDDLALDKMWRITAGHPYFLQLLCHSLVNRHNRTKQTYITVADVNIALDEILASGEAHFVYLWTESTPEERLILTSLSRFMPLHGQITPVLVMDQLADRGIMLDRIVVTEAMHHLALRDILTAKSDNTDVNSFYGWKLGLLGLWAEKYRSIGRVVEEMRS